ncbi:MAG TPA: class I SAM-dependent methyltransferase [Cyclobacteriaceae bacterium]|nr:class I SAM-dependent methyltransferase [Cyclobacteriaceae bacterium]
MNCRFCNTPLTTTFVDLGMSPLCEDFVKPGKLNEMERFYPLHAYVCSECFLVQLEEFVSPEVIYRDYPYFSSYSDSWLSHSKRYTDLIVNRFEIGKESLVAELASNDGYLLQFFNEKQIPVLGIEPAGTVAARAREKGIRTEEHFFGNAIVGKLIEQYGQPDLLIGNNVLAHVPNINDFVSAMKVFLKSDGVITMEFPHLLKLIEGNQFDTIYHEHFSYLSFTTVNRIFEHHGLELFDVEELPTHGGSLRIYAKHREDVAKKISGAVSALLEREREAGMTTMEYYSDFNQRVINTKWNVLEFLIMARREGKTIAGYGAPGKAATLLNYCGIRTDFIEFTVDRNPVKHGCYMAGTHIPIFSPEKIRETKPDYVFILPWNLKTEIMESLSYIKEWGGQFVIPIPEVTVYEPLSELV